VECHGLQPEKGFRANERSNSVHTNLFCPWGNYLWDPHGSAVLKPFYFYESLQYCNIHVAVKYLTLWFLLSVTKFVQQIDGHFT
jgi:hypothetical protein